MTYPPDRLAPCGTAAAARRHWRKGEEPCGDCREAANRDRAERLGYRPGAQSVIYRGPARNGLPEAPGYSYRARTYPWAQRVLAASEATHGSPGDHDLDDLGYLLDSGYARQVSA